MSQKNQIDTQCPILCLAWGTEPLPDNKHFLMSNKGLIHVTLKRRRDRITILLFFQIEGVLMGIPKRDLLGMIVSLIQTAGYCFSAV